MHLACPILRDVTRALDTCDWHAMMQLGYVDYPDTYLTEMDIEMLLDSPFIRVRQ